MSHDTQPLESTLQRVFGGTLKRELQRCATSGLGTFGLCDGLITPVGKAVRIGSVIAKVRISSSPRPYNVHHAYCLH